jgi:16S rRNA (guanine527-N7)-methyltransferase
MFVRMARSAGPLFHVKHADDLRNDVSRETHLRLEAYVALLLRWNRTINLISRRDEAQIWTRHIHDSLGLLPLLPPGFSHAIDLGSGAGLPGLVLAIATNRPFHLVEADQRKAAFLREAARTTGAPATIHNSRIEASSPPLAPVITARALAPLVQLLAWSAPLLLPGGICIFPKGRTAADELTQARAQWQMQVDITASTLDPSACILTVSEIARASPDS